MVSVLPCIQTQRADTTGSVNDILSVHKEIVSALLVQSCSKEPYSVAELDPSLTLHYTSDGSRKQDLLTVGLTKIEQWTG